MYAKRLKKAEAVREQWLREYHIQNLKDNAPRSISASMFWLERRYPNEFALRRVDRDDHSAEKQIYAELTREQLLASIARAKELEAEAPVGWQPALPEVGGSVEQST
jgi:hypothetical protein